MASRVFDLVVVSLFKCDKPIYVVCLSTDLSSKHSTSYDHHEQ